MEIVDLVDRSAEAALNRAAHLRAQLRAAEEHDPAVRGCCAEAHRLVGDIVSLRNAAELLKQQLAETGPPPTPRLERTTVPDAS
ncbi:MAG TPA: hypothetical protein VFT70_04530 [Nocardioides sp.]|nr:hypothetical protein [Nocardioides sp.]